MNSLELSALKIAIDDQASEELPKLAAEALAQGVDSPSLREVAGASTRDDPRDVRERYLAALDELGIDVPQAEQAAWRLTRDVATRIVGRQISPLEGAEWIWRVASSRVEHEGDLRVFIGLASECEDHPERCAEYETQIRAAAQQLLARSNPRTWITLQARTGRSPLHQNPWQDDRDFDATQLPIRSDLRQHIAEWAATFEARKPGATGPSGFALSAEADRFAQRGAVLARELQRELGDDWHVEYMPTATRLPR